MIWKTEEFFRSHPNGGIGEAARRCGISESGLYALFQRSGRSSPNELRQKILVEKARELLVSTDRPVEEISRQLNFSSASYFRKILKKIHGPDSQGNPKAGGFLTYSFLLQPSIL